MSEGRMTAEQTPDIEAVLAEHAQDFSAGPFVIGCTCGESFPSDGAHRAHVAQALAPVLAAAVREARAGELREAADKVMRHGSDGGPVRLVTVRRWLLDRADRIDVDAPEGGA